MYSLPAEGFDVKAFELNFNVEVNLGLKEDLDLNSAVGRVEVMGAVVDGVSSYGVSIDAGSIGDFKSPTEKLNGGDGDIV
ncbi:hypothetical protein JRQ81_003370 [Phrynocephalus forsythii]|uniref:Uncharacterized protein n=1 Tax=Phrynocephalus forsythii TaxID=171643 RepID=A0A9Q0XJQ1_9SAUR|nr:hypothetical protein JRQ81_003370 [Phrynocephalus forsythii]